MAHDVHGIREGHRRDGHEGQHVVHAPVAADDDLDPAVVRSDGDVEIVVEANRPVLRLGERARLGADLRRAARHLERLDDLVPAADLAHDDLDGRHVDPRRRADAEVAVDGLVGRDDLVARPRRAERRAR